MLSIIIGYTIESVCANATQPSLNQYKTTIPCFAISRRLFVTHIHIYIYYNEVLTKLYLAERLCSFIVIMVDPQCSPYYRIILMFWRAFTIYRLAINTYDVCFCCSHDRNYKKKIHFDPNCVSRFKMAWTTELAKASPITLFCARREYLGPVQL